MTNEIKEILDLFYNEYSKEEKTLEKYITDLQDEIESSKKEIDKLTNIEYNCDFLEWHNKDKQTRIDKAINYILENICCDTRIYTKSENVYKVVDILRGDE